MSEDAESPSNSIPPSSGTLRDRIGSILADAHALRRSRNFEEAVSQYELCLELARSIQHDPHEIICLTCLGSLNYRLGENGLSRQYFERAIERSRETADPRLEALALNSLAQLSMHEEDYEGSQSNFRAALAIRQRMGDRTAVARTNFDMGRVLEKMGHHDEAIEQFVLAKEQFVKIGEIRQESLVLTDLASLYVKLRDFGRCINCLQRALAIEQRRHDELREGNVLAVFGSLFYEFKQFDQSFKYYERASTCFQNAEAKRKRIEVLRWMVKIREIMRKNDGEEEAGEAEGSGITLPDLPSVPESPVLPPNEDANGKTLPDAVSSIASSEVPPAVEIGDGTTTETQDVDVGVDVDAPPPDTDPNSEVIVLRGELADSRCELKRAQAEFQTERRRLLDRIQQLEQQVQSRDDVIEKLLQQ